MSHLFLELFQEIVEWYMAIRFAKLKMLKESEPGRDESELAKETTKDFTHEGKVWKRGPRVSYFMSFVMVTIVLSEIVTADWRTTSDYCARTTKRCF